MRVFQQIWHGGHIYPVLDQSPPWGVSTVPNPATGIVPNPMGIAEIEEVIAAFAASARRCREGGIDGIEIHASHGYLIMQRSEEHTSELPSLMRTSYAVFCLKKKNRHTIRNPQLHYYHTII